MSDWGTFLNNTAQGLIDRRVSDLSAPAKPVSLNPATGKTYTEGKPDASVKPLFGMPPAVVIGGGVLLALATAYFLLRK